MMQINLLSKIEKLANVKYLSLGIKSSSAGLVRVDGPTIYRHHWPRDYFQQHSTASAFLEMMQPIGSSVIGSSIVNKLENVPFAPTALGSVNSIRTDLASAISHHLIASRICVTWRGSFGTIGTFWAVFQVPFAPTALHLDCSIQRIQSMS